MSDSDLIEQLDALLSVTPYIDGYTPSVVDVAASHFVKSTSFEKKPHISRWFAHIQSFDNNEQSSFRSTADSDFAKKLLRDHPIDTKKMSSQVSASINLDDLPQTILHLLDKRSEAINTILWASEIGCDHQKVIGAVKSLLNQQDLISTSDVTEKRIELSAEGKEMAAAGSHEFNVYQAIAENGTPQPKIMALPIGKVGVSKALASGWIAIDKTGGEVKLIRKASPENVVDLVRQQLNDLSIGKDVDEKAKADLKKRKLIAEIVVKGLSVSKGSNFSTEISKPEVDLTPEMITSGSWKTKTFKDYNFNALGVQPQCGHLHPLMKVRSEFRQIFFSMGFSEMPTNRYVESSFWNFDALFQPQQHPARDAHDTFFISEPAISTQFPQEYLEKVKTVHSKGGFGSIGYNYDWKLEEAQKNVLRTHTTAVSARQLYQLAQEKEFKPAKMFSIDRVFRNETLDATHLAEFHQVEGVIAERNLSLAHLIGIFTEFFKKLGIVDLRFKPTYNPYTEPSMEIFAYHKGLKKWVEIGNSGMFRPEMLLPMGLPPDVNVAGYGLSLERPTMIRYGIDNIRDMFGPKIDIQMIIDGPICRLDKVKA